MSYLDIGELTPTERKLLVTLISEDIEKQMKALKESQKHRG